MPPPVLLLLSLLLSQGVRIDISAIPICCGGCCTLALLGSSCAAALVLRTGQPGAPF
jgi:hypothetical protein